MVALRGIKKFYHLQTQMSSIADRTSNLEKELKLLKLEVKKELKLELKKEKKPKNIEDCKSKDDLKKFTIKELKEWLKKKEINIKKITEKHKNDFVNIVWKNISEHQESSSDESESSDSDSD